MNGEMSCYYGYCLVKCIETLAWQAVNRVHFSEVNCMHLGVVIDWLLGG
jgi:hypothetical protein